MPMVYHTWMSARTQAKKVARYFLKGDDHIARYERSYDTLWESGNGDDVASEFRKLYDANEELRTACRRSRYFSPGMVGKDDTK